MKATEVFLVDYTDFLAMVALAKQFKQESRQPHYVIYNQGDNYKITIFKPIDPAIIVHSEE